MSVLLQIFRLLPRKKLGAGMFTFGSHAIFEELVADNVPRTRAVYLEALRRIPHAEFTLRGLDIVRQI